MVKTIYRAVVIICKEAALRFIFEGLASQPFKSSYLGPPVQFYFPAVPSQFSIQTPRFRYRAKSSHSR